MQIVIRYTYCQANGTAWQDKWWILRQQVCTVRVWIKQKESNSYIWSSQVYEIAGKLRAIIKLTRAMKSSKDRQICKELS